MLVRRHAKPTLSAVELNHGDVLEFIRFDGNAVRFEILDSQAEIVHTTLDEPGTEIPAALTIYKFWCDIKINGHQTRLTREVGTQASFYEPWLFEGVHVWLDAVDAIFSFMHETHAPCRLQPNCLHGLPSRREVRLALQDETARICPERVHPWCPLPDGCLRIEDCYRGEDCWLGAFDGASAHGGLDINHPPGTPIWSPIALDDQFYYNSLEAGSNNNRWRGIRQWKDHSMWIFICNHMTRLTVPEHTPLAAGQHYADGAGVHSGDHHHSHFGFVVVDHGEYIYLDPWILFWQMYRDQAGLHPLPSA